MKLHTPFQRKMKTAREYPRSFYFEQLLDLIFILMYPLIGWTPIWIYMAVRSIVHYRKHRSSKIRFCYLGLTALALVFLLMNVFHIRIRL